MRIETERLVLRPWEERDRVPFAAIVGDPHVMRFYTHPRTREEADAWFDGMIDRYAQGTSRFLAAEHRANGALLGMVGTADINFEIPTGPKTEVGWILAQAFWGQGFAPEAAKASLAYAFDTLGLEEVVAFTAHQNLPSQRVMEKIGMRRDVSAGFDHPRLPEDHPLRPQVLYRIANPRSA